MINWFKHMWEYDRIMLIVFSSVAALVVLIIWGIIASEGARQQRIVDCLESARTRYSTLEQTGDIMMAYETARNGCYLANKAPESSGSTTVVIR